VSEDNVQDRNGQFERMAEALQIAEPFEQQAAHYQIEHERLGNA
jgi:hypothetical protein